MSIKYLVFCVTICADLRKKVGPTIDIYIAKSSRAIHLTCCRGISVELVRILEFARNFSTICVMTQNPGKLLMIEFII